jgi:hypothetical protein
VIGPTHADVEVGDQQILEVLLNFKAQSIEIFVENAGIDEPVLCLGKADRLATGADAALWLSWLIGERLPPQDCGPARRTTS